MNKISSGDLVKVSFYGAQMTLCECAEVLHEPCATGDSWIFRDTATGAVHYVSEGCTISKYVDAARAAGERQLD